MFSCSGRDHVVQESVDDFSGDKTTVLINANIDFEVSMGGNEFDDGDSRFGNDGNVGCYPTAFECARQDLQNCFFVSMLHGVRKHHKINVTNEL